VLYQDGVFCEFAVFEQAELAAMPFSPGRVVWKEPNLNAQIAHPQQPPRTQTPSVAW
jgi:hypothetical protein